jgi:VWFA-related protein
LVQVGVVVHDKKGQPVADLAKDDFTLADEGQPQKIAFFSVESALAPVAPARTLPPNYFTNRLEFRSSAPASVTAILFDALNTAFEDQVYSKNQLIKFLGQVRPEDRFALYVLGRDLRVLHDFTTDTRSLLRVLARHRGASSPDWEASEPAPSDTGIEELDAWLNESSQMLSDFLKINRARQTTDALEAIARHLARVPGRKNLIWLSAGFPFSIGFDDLDEMLEANRERRHFGEEIERTARALNDANLAVYPVDARGLVGLDEFRADVRRAPPRAGAKGGGGVPRRIWQNQQTMLELAERTGGEAYYNRNDLDRAIRQAVEDARVTYVLGYYPAHDTWDGRFRKLKVQVRRKGVEVRYRTGYFAFHEQKETPRERDQLLREAVRTPLDATGISLLVRVASDAPPKPGRWKIFVVVDPRTVALEAQGDRWAGALDLLFVQQAPDGRELRAVKDILTLRLTRDTYQRILKEGAVVIKVLDLLPAAAQLRVVVRDPATGNLGAVTIPVSQVRP